MGSLGETLGHHCDHRYAVKRLPSHPTDIKIRHFPLHFGAADGAYPLDAGCESEGTGNCRGFGRGT